MTGKNQTEDKQGEIAFHLDTKFTVAEAAKELKVSTRTIRDWCKERKLGSRRVGIGRGRIVITGSQIDELADERLRSRLAFILFGDTADAAELDPAYEPLTITEVDIDTLTDEELEAAIILPPDFDRFDASVLKRATSNNQDEHDPNDLRWFHDFLSGKVNE